MPPAPAPAPSAPPWSTLAALLEYPGPDWAARVDQARRQWSARHPTLALEAALAPLAHSSVAALEEAYAEAFELNPSCALYVGAHLFGEEHRRRGEFLARLSARFQDTGFAPGREVPDHLAVLLRFLPWTAPGEREDLVRYCLLGPLDRMVRSLPPEHPFAGVLGWCGTLLRIEFPALEPVPWPEAAPQPVPSPAEGSRAKAVCGWAGCGCGTATPTMEPSVHSVAS